MFKNVNYVGKLIDKAYDGRAFTEKEEKFINEFIYGDGEGVSSRQRALFTSLIEAQVFKGMLDAEV